MPDPICTIVRMASGDEQHLNATAAASGCSVSSERLAPLISNIHLRSKNKSSEMAMKLSKMDLKSDAMLAMLQSTGLQYQAKCVMLTVESQWVTCAALWGERFMYEELTELDSPRLFRTLRRRMPVIINDMTKNPTTLEGVALDSTVRGYVSAPVCVFAQYVGSVCMTFNEPQQLNVDKLRDFQSVANKIGQLLEARFQSDSHEQYPQA